MTAYQIADQMEAVAANLMSMAGDVRKLDGLAQFSGQLQTLLDQAKQFSVVISPKTAGA